MDLDKLIELIEKYPNLPAVLQSGHLAAYQFKQGLNIDTKEYQALELELILAKIIVRKSNYTRATNEALQYLGEKEIDFENIRVLENLYPGIIGMFESGGVTSGHVSIAYKIPKEQAQRIISDAAIYGLVKCHQYKAFIPKDVKKQLKEKNLL